MDTEGQRILRNKFKKINARRHAADRASLVLPTHGLSPKQQAIARRVKIVTQPSGSNVDYLAKSVRFFYGETWIDVIPQIDGSWEIRGLNPLVIELNVSNQFIIKERP